LALDGTVCEIKKPLGVLLGICFCVEPDGYIGGTRDLKRIEMLENKGGNGNEEN
jgi:hypothetical protein